MRDDETEHGSDYAVTRDFSDFMSNKREELSRMAGSRSLRPHPSGAEHPVSTIEALALATAIRRQAETLEAHWRERTRRQYMDIVKAQDEHRTRYERALMDSGATPLSGDST